MKTPKLTFQRWKLQICKNTLMECSMFSMRNLCLRSQTKRICLVLIWHLMSTSRFLRSKNCRFTKRKRKLICWRRNGNRIKGMFRCLTEWIKSGRIKSEKSLIEWTQIWLNKLFKIHLWLMNQGFTCMERRNRFRGRTREIY